jgi:hypothetical protein
MAAASGAGSQSFSLAHRRVLTRNRAMAADYGQAGQKIDHLSGFVD